MPQAAQADRGWISHTLAEAIDVAATQALDILLQQKAFCDVLDALLPDDRVRLIANLLSLEVTVSPETAAFIAHVGDGAITVCQAS